jgi:hypothetical protein
VKKRAEQVLPGSGGGESGWVRGGEGWRGAVAQTMYTHVSKCKNNNKILKKIKNEVYYLIMSSLKFILPIIFQYDLFPL